MSILSKIKKQRERRKLRVRSKLRQFHNNTKIRVSVCRSLKYITGQVIDDSLQKTIFSISSRTLVSDAIKISKIDQAYQAGILVGQKLLENNKNEIVFDRGSYLYHGRVKAFADGIRSVGIAF
jgi:large subunit ribosomal protein L18